MPSHLFKVLETGEDKKHLKVSKRRRLEVVGENKRFKKETVFSYGDVKLTVTDAITLEASKEAVSAQR